MNNQKFTEFKTKFYAYYDHSLNNDHFTTDQSISSNNIILDAAFESMNDNIVYNDLIASGEILNDFKEKSYSSYCDLELKDYNKEKLTHWLQDQDIVNLFEHDFIVTRATQYYKSPRSFYVFSFDEYEEDLEYWLDGEQLTEDQKDEIESDLCCFITDDQRYLYTHFIGFEFTLPRAAILREYADYIRSNR